MTKQDNSAPEAVSIDNTEFRELLQAHIRQFMQTAGLNGQKRAELIAHIDAAIAKTREEVASHQQRHIDQLKAQLAGLDNMFKIAIKERDALAARQTPDLEKLKEALEIGRDAAQEVANRCHQEFAGYKEHRHKAVDDDVATIEAALAMFSAQPTAKPEQIEPQPAHAGGDGLLLLPICCNHNCNQGDDCPLR